MSRSGDFSDDDDDKQTKPITLPLVHAHRLNMLHTEVQVCMQFALQVCSDVKNVD